MIQQIIDFGKSLPNELGIMFLSMLPLTELRAAIPIFIAKGMQPFLAYIMAVIGNMLPVPFVLALARPLFKWMKIRILGTCSVCCDSPAGDGSMDGSVYCLNT